MRGGIIRVGALIICLGACGQKPDRPDEVVMPSYVEPVPDPTPTFTPAAYATEAPRSHNYEEVEASTYYYIAAVSEEERKLGKAAGSVSGFRYLGRNADGEHILASVSDAGAIGYYSRCPEKCVIIHFSNGDRSAYTPSSIIGAAFEDAIKGRLKRWTPPRPEQPVYYDPPQAAQSTQTYPTSTSTPEIAPTEAPQATETQPARE